MHKGMLMFNDTFTCQQIISMLCTRITLLINVCRPALGWANNCVVERVISIAWLVGKASIVDLGYAHVVFLSLHSEISWAFSVVVCTHKPSIFYNYHKWCFLQDNRPLFLGSNYLHCFTNLKSCRVVTLRWASMFYQGFHRASIKMVSFYR